MSCKQINCPVYLKIGRYIRDNKFVELLGDIINRRWLGDDRAKPVVRLVFFLPFCTSSRAYIQQIWGSIPKSCSAD